MNNLKLGSNDLAKQLEVKDHELKETKQKFRRTEEMMEQLQDKIDDTIRNERERIENLGIYDASLRLSRAVGRGVWGMGASAFQFVTGNW